MVCKIEGFLGIVKWWYFFLWIIRYAEKVGENLKNKILSWKFFEKFEFLVTVRGFLLPTFYNY